MALSMANLLRYKTRHDFELETHISLKNRYVYFSVSKSGSSTVKYYLQQKEFEGTRFTVQDVNNNYVSPLLSPYQLSDEALLTVLESTEFKKVAFVRNPYARLLSCFLHRIVASPDSPSAKRFRRLEGLSEGQVPTFPAFVMGICGQSDEEMDRHWRPQVSEIPLEIERLTFVGRAERMADDLGTLGIHLFGAEGFQVPGLGSINASPMKTGADQQLSKFYNDIHIEMVFNRYQIDFETFGYDAGLPAY